MSSSSVLVHATLAPYGAVEPRRAARPHSAQLQRRMSRPDSAAQRTHSTAAAVAALLARPASATAASRTPLSQSTSIPQAQQVAYAQAERMHAQFQPAAYQPAGPASAAATPQARRMRPASARPASAARGRSKSPSSANSYRAGSPVRSAVSSTLMIESSESRLHSLSLQCLHASWTREWPKLVSLRIECLGMSKLISGPSSPAVHLARLALAEAYLRADSWAQSVEHAKHLPGRFEAEMEYAQGAFDAHMLLGRAYFGLSREIGSGFVTDGAVSGTSTAAEVSRALAQSVRHFTAAHALSQRPAAEFFKHTTIRDPAMQRKIAMSKAMDAQMGLSCSIGAQGGKANATKQLDTLTGMWERLDAHLGAEARAREAQRSSAADSSTAASASAAPDSDPAHSINTSLQALELYFYLGHAFFQHGDEPNAIDNLQRALSVARHNPETLSAGLDQELVMPQAAEDEDQYNQAEESKQSSSGSNSKGMPFPHPSTIHYPRVMLLVESSMLLAVSLARAYQYAEAIEAFRVCKRMLTNLRRFNVLAKGYWETKWREPQPLPRSAAAQAADAPVQLAPVPTHEPTDSTHVNHTAIDLAFQALQDREHAYHFNVFVCYSFEKLASFCAKGLLQVARESALLHLAQAQYEEAARCQEEVCAMIEHEEGADEDDPEAASWTARAAAQDSASSAAATDSPVTGQYQLDVVKAQRRLGDIYSAAGQPRTAKAAYTTALGILQVLYGVKKVHNVAVQHARHSSYSSSSAVLKRPSSPAPRAGKAGFGSTSVLSLGSSAELAAPLSPSAASSQSGAEHALPAPIYKLLSSLRQSIRQMREEIRNEGLTNTAGQEAGADAAESAQAAEAPSTEEPAPSADAAAHSTDAYVADTFDASPSASRSDLPRNRSPPRASKTASSHLHHGATKRARAALKARQLNDFTPASPHVGRKFNAHIGDQMSGESSVIRESLGLRLAADSEADQRGGAAYDSFIVEKQAAREALRKANLAAAQAEAQAKADAEEGRPEPISAEEELRAQQHAQSDSTVAEPKSS